MEIIYDLSHFDFGMTSWCQRGWIEYFKHNGHQSFRQNGAKSNKEGKNPPMSSCSTCGVKRDQKRMTRQEAYRKANKSNNNSQEPC